MNTRYGIFCLITAGAFSASATTVWLENGGKDKLTTGDGLDKVKDIAATAEVVEIPGLSITAKTAAANLEINALSDSLGVINKNNEEDDRSCFEKDEAILLSFDKAVRISGIDFNHFDKGEAFALQVGDTKHVITYDALANKTSDTFECDLAVAAGTEIRMNVAAEGSVIGLDALEIEVMSGEEAATAKQPTEDPDKKGLIGKLLNRD